MTITISLTVSTLKRKLKQYNWRNTIVEIIDGPGSSVGYRSAKVWHFLEQKGIGVPWSKVEEIVCELDLDGVEARKTHRREYNCPGPNKAWPQTIIIIKIRPSGYPINSWLGINRKVLWLYVTRSDNLPCNIAAYHLDALRENGGWPLELYTNLGTENGILWLVYSLFRNCRAWNWNCRE